MAELLFHRTMGSGEPLVILHGFLGSSDNWQTAAKILSEFYQVTLVDQRNHGRSFHADKWNYQVMVDDLKFLLDNLEISKAHFLGHSMGGKTVMEFCNQYPSYCDKVIVADIAPKAYPVHHQQILDGMSQLPLDTLKSRKEAEALISESIKEQGTRLFILKNLGRNGNGFFWKPNLPILNKKIKSIGEGLSSDSPYHGSVLFVKGELSDYILEEDWPEIVKLFPNSQLATIPNASHWVHADQPQKFLELISDYLS